MGFSILAGVIFLAMLSIHPISDKSAHAVDVPKGSYGLLMLESGEVRLVRGDGHVHVLASAGIYLFTADCSLLIAVCGDSRGELICFDRTFYSFCMRHISIVAGLRELQTDGFPLEIGHVDFAQLKRDIDLLKDELDRSASVDRLRLAFSLVMCAVFAEKIRVGCLSDQGIGLEEFNMVLEANFCSNRSTAFYSKRLGVSARGLNSWCRSRFSGKGFYGVLIDRLMDEAEHRLLCSTEPIKVIGYELGFKSVQHFRTYFVRYRGMSPSGFRLRYSNTVEAGQLF